MKEAFLAHSIHFITENQTGISNEDKEKLTYGLEGLYLTITKLIIINIIALVLGIWKEFFISLLLFNILRFPGFGFHANNSFTCLCVSTLLMIGTPALLLSANITLPIKVISSVICIGCFILYAPADTEKRPLTNRKKRMIRKFAASILSIIYGIIIILLKDNNIAMLFLSGLIIETILILPITYKIFGMSYKNYLKI